MSLKHVHLSTVSPRNYILNLFEKKLLRFLNSIPLLAILLQKSLSAHIIMEILKTNFQ